MAGQQKSLVEREARVLRALYHPFIADFHGTLVSPLKVMFISQFLPGGELWSLLYSPQQRTQRPRGPHGGLPVTAATYFAAIIALALEHIHALGYIYRDLKVRPCLLRLLHPFAYIHWGITLTLTLLPLYLGPWICGHGSP